MKNKSSLPVLAPSLACHSTSASPACAANKIKSAAFLVSLSCLLFLILPIAARAHEVYVLSREQIEFGENNGGPKVLRVLLDPNNFPFVAYVTLAILALLVLNLFFICSQTGKRLDQKLRSYAKFSPILVRIAISASFIYGAFESSFLGPEISLAVLGNLLVLKFLLILCGVMFFFGFLTELAALAGLVLYFVAARHYGSYLLTYLNYFGSMLAFLFFGSRIFSADSQIFYSKMFLPKFKEYGTLIVRVFYGLSLIYMAVDVKILHPMLSYTVVTEYNLTKFHLLFPNNPLLIVAGAAIVEFAIGLFIILGFQLRLTVLISLFYLTLSLLFFKEAVWPHIILYGVSINLLINGGGKLALDSWLATHFQTPKLKFRQ